MENTKQLIGCRGLDGETCDAVIAGFVTQGLPSKDTADRTGIPLDIAVSSLNGSKQESLQGAVKTMNRRILIISVIIVIVLLSMLTIYMWIQPKEFKVGDDEIALYIQLDTKEDIGLLVFDYSANGIKYSGGTSNADKSLLKHDERLIEVWDQESLNCFTDSVELYIQFRIITEYTDPNYENIYPENLTKYMEPVSFEANFGESYYFTITGDNISGYTPVQN